MLMRTLTRSSPVAARARNSARNFATALDLRPIAEGPAHFGREVCGVDLADDYPGEAIVSSLYEHVLLLIRNQAHLTPEDEMRFAKLFSHQPDDSNQSYTGGAGTQHRLPQFPSVALVGTYNVTDYFGLTASSPGVYNGWHPEQRAWHCDGLADTSPPPDLTTIRCVITPPSGGETLFACTVKAAELLPSHLDPPPLFFRLSRINPFPTLPSSEGGSFERVRKAPLGPPWPVPHASPRVHGRRTGATAQDSLS